MFRKWELRGYNAISMREVDEWQYSLMSTRRLTKQQVAVKNDNENEDNEMSILEIIK